MSENETTQKQKLEQKKARLLLEEAKLKIKERKNRTRRLIELGGLIVKANLDLLPNNTLYGALLSLEEAIKTNPKVEKLWTEKGAAAFEKESKERTPIILQFTDKPDPEMRDQIRKLGLKWNSLRSEWYGYITDMDSLKQLLKDINHRIEIMD